MDVIARIAEELAVKAQQVSATVALLDMRVRRCRLLRVIVRK